MEVKEMIEALSKFDLEAEVLYCEYGITTTPVEIIKTKEGNAYICSNLGKEFKDKILWSDPFYF